MVLWDTSPPSSQSAGFPNKVVIPVEFLNNLSLDLLACRAMSSMSLGLGNKKEISLAACENRIYGLGGDGWVERKRETNQEMSTILEETGWLWTEVVVVELMKSDCIRDTSGIKGNRISSHKGCRV